MSTASGMLVEGFFDPTTSTISYLLLDTESRDCALIDSVLDFDAKSGRTRAHSADRLLTRVAELGATVCWLLKTHVHADHLSAAQDLKSRVGGAIAISAELRRVQHVFGRLFNVGHHIFANCPFGRLLDDGEILPLGSLSIHAIHTPGHTPACMTYFCDDGAERVAFVGDTLFMPDYGTARCDFPGGDAHALYRSIARVLDLPPDTRLYTCHDYQPGGREVACMATVAEQKISNVHARNGITEQDFVAMRNARDATLDMPALMLPSVQVNMCAGHLPEPEDNGVRYLKIPLDAI